MKGIKMPNKHFCQGPTCHEQTTQDRFLKSRGVVRGRYAYANRDSDSGWRYADSDKYFCSQSCKLQWLSVNMENIEHGRPIEFIRHRRESGGYEKVTEEHESNWRGHYTTTEIKRVDNRTELD
tara:strand:- start:137 stop:505 length:369 start_codon:yes stop_codon:yes gene_type:complete